MQLLIQRLETEKRQRSLELSRQLQEKDNFYWHQLEQAEIHSQTINHEMQQKLESQAVQINN